MEKWLKQFVENYEGKSKEAKSIEDFMKENYKGNNYIPWATMERLTYMQDPNATFETITKENGEIVFTDSMENFSEVIADGVVKNSTKASMVSHFVKVKLVFLGKEFIEEYPIQDQDYSALKIYNQNAVNKALKRALAKVASRGTGLGLRLYENKDLQFDSKEEEDAKPIIKKVDTKTKSTVEKTVKKVEKTQPNVETGQVSEQVSGQVEKQDALVQEEPKQEVKVETSASYSNDVLELCKLIKETPSDKMTIVLQNLNVAILKQHQFTLSQEDSDDVLCEKLTHFKDVTIFTKAIKNMLG